MPEVRLIDELGNQVGIVPTREALTMARDRGLDLMEISPNAAPPVCKICDYGKFKYEKKKKEHQARKKQTVIKVKEIQLRPQTEEHDLDYKFKNARTFLEEGDKVKVTIMFRGREVAYADQGYKMMRQLADLVKDMAIVESPAKLEGKKMIMILSPSAGGAPPPKRAVINPRPAGDRPAGEPKAASEPRSPIAPRVIEPRIIEPNKPSSGSGSGEGTSGT